MPSTPAYSSELEQTALSAVGGGSVLRLHPLDEGRWRALVIARGGRPVAVDMDPVLGTAVVFPRTAVAAHAPLGAAA